MISLGVINVQSFLGFIRFCKCRPSEMETAAGIFGGDGIPRDGRFSPKSGDANEAAVGESTRLVRCVKLDGESPPPGDEKIIDSPLCLPCCAPAENTSANAAPIISGSRLCTVRICKRVRMNFKCRIKFPAGYFLPPRFVWLKSVYLNGQ